MPAGALGDNKDSRLKIATFYHSMTGNNTFNNINIVYNTHITDPSPYGSGIIFDRDGYNIDQATKRIYYTAKGAIDGVKQVADADRNKYGNTVKFTDYMYPENDQTFKNTVGNRQGLKVTNYNYSWVTSVKNSNVFGDAHNNTSSDYQTLINTYLPQIIDDILEADYEVTIENDKGTSTQTALQDIMKRITNILNAINSKEGEGSADSKITNFLNQILVGNDKNNAELKESIQQSINFLRAFYDGYNGSEQAVTKASYNKNIFNSFASNTNYKNATDKYNNTIKGGMNNLKTTINGKLTDIKTLEDTLKNLADALNKAQELNNQGTALNQQVENYKNQIESLNNEIANLEKAIAGLGGMIGQDKLQPMKKQLEAKKAERDQARTNGEKAIAQIQSLKTQLATLKNNVDDYVTTINGIRDGFKNTLNINNPQAIDVMGAGNNGSFTYRGVGTIAQNDITDNINVPSMNPDPDPITPPGGGGGTDPVDPTPDPNPDPITPPGGGDGGDGTDPDPNPITPPEGGGGGTDPDPDPTDPTNPPGGGDGTDPTNPTNPTDPDNGGNNGGGDNGNNGGDNGNNGDNGDNEDNSYEGDDTVNNNGGYDARLAYLNYKREVLELPAEEETSIEINEGREKGRLCIVSDNAKTNNPCMAITY
nr:hypothetical protein [Helicobacter pullorum]